MMRLPRSVDQVQRPAYYDETNGGRIFLAAVAASTPASRGPASAVGAPSRPDSIDAILKGADPKPQERVRNFALWGIGLRPRPFTPNKQAPPTWKSMCAG